MYLGYQKGKVKFYTEEELNLDLYNLEKSEYTDEEYVISSDGTEYVLKTPEWEEEQARKKRARLDKLNLTKADFWIALVEKGITKQMVKDMVEAAISDKLLKAKTLIRIDDADHFWRGDASMNIIGMQFGISSDDLDYLFQKKQLPDDLVVVIPNINSAPVENTPEGEENPQEDNSTQTEETLENIPDLSAENEDLDNNEGEQENDN